MPGWSSTKGPTRRRASGEGLDSIRTTSAPWSARYLETMGPTPTQAKSATRRPANGFLSAWDIGLHHHLQLEAPEPGLVDAQGGAVHLGVMFIDVWLPAELFPGR